MALLMGIVNLTPDSFFKPSRAMEVGKALARMSDLLEAGADIIDIGAVSTRPGAEPVGLEEEWSRLEPVLRATSGAGLAPFEISVDTTRSEIVRRTYELLGPFIVNDISAGDDDEEMLRTVGDLGLKYVAMHKRGDPRTMDSLADYPQGVVSAVLEYFDRFAVKAALFDIKDWILDPGFGFAKTEEQNMELLDNLASFKRFGRPILVGISNKRFTRGRTSRLQALAVKNGADILRVHDIPAFFPE